jgi:hypothetical protein
MVSSGRRPSRRELLAASLVGVATLRARPSAAAGPAISVIVHPSVSVAKLGEAELAAIFGGVRRQWDDGNVIRLFNLPPNHPARTELDRVVLHMSPDEVARYWIDRRIRGEGTPPRHVPTPELLLRLVASLASSIGYVPDDKLGPGVKIVARVRDGKVVAP